MTGLPRLRTGHRVKLIMSGVPETGCLFLVSCGKVVQAFRGVGTAAIFVSKPEIMVTPEIRAALLRFHNEVGASVEHAGLDLERMKFDGDFQTIQVDVAVRNYLVATLRAKCQANTV